MGRWTEDELAASREAAIVQNYGQSTYAPPGRLSGAQRDHHAREMLDLLAGASERAGFEQGHRLGYEAGQRAAARELAALRRELEGGSR